MDFKSEILKTIQRIEKNNEEIKERKEKIRIINEILKTKNKRFVF